MKRPEPTPPEKCYVVAIVRNDEAAMSTFHAVSDFLESLDAQQTHNEVWTIDGPSEWLEPKLSTLADRFWNLYLCALKPRPFGKKDTTAVPFFESENCRGLIDGPRGRGTPRVVPSVSDWLETYRSKIHALIHDANYSENLAARKKAINSGNTHK